MTNSGVGVPGVIGIVFIILKLVGVIQWSWWWVLCPFWIPLAIFLVFLITFGFIVGIVMMVKTMLKI